VEGGPHFFLKIELYIPKGRFLFQLSTRK